MEEYNKAVMDILIATKIGKIPPNRAGEDEQ
jgi:hypothetical protein